MPRAPRPLSGGLRATNTSGPTRTQSIGRGFLASCGGKRSQRRPDRGHSLPSRG